MTPTLRRIIAARTAMLLDDPFFGSLALRLAVREDESANTAWTDGASMCFAPSYVQKLDNDGLKAVIAHEVMHCAAGHPWRRDARDVKRFNVAADYAINGILHEAGYRLPADVLMPDASQTGKSAEWIYARLPEPPPPDKSGGKGKPQPGQPQPGPGQPEPGQPDDAQDDNPGMGDVRDAPSTDPADPNQPAPSEQEWKQAVQQAATQAKRAGRLPAGLARLAAEAVRPKVDWRAELRALLESSRNDYSWARPNPRYCHMGLYLPVVDAPEMPPLAVAVDTSGSIDGVALAAMKAELEAIIAETSPAAVYVLYADARVCHADTFERGDMLTWRPAGGGGTDFRPACAAVEAMEAPPVALVYLTDLEGSFPAQPPTVPVIWVTAGDLTAPFGSTLRMEDGA